MYGPSKGDMQFLVSLAVVGIVSIVVLAVLAVVWIANHVSVAL